ncbi:MAG: hypothetical protein AMXMBFR82_27270 [Candidatus Hydrogenedentota bacterium]
MRFFLDFAQVYRMRARLLLSAVAIVVAFAGASCSDNGTQEITETRTVDPATSSAPAMAGTPATMVSASPVATYTWDAPDSWQELPSTPNRSANFKVDPEADAECYLTVLSGTGGGVEANVNRWRAQLTLEPVAAAELAEYPTVQVLGQDALLVEFEGAYKGMGDEAQDGYKLLGLILEDRGHAVFVKMTGPAAVVDREKENFLSFAESLEAATAQPATQLPEGHPPIPGQEQSQLPEGHPEIPGQSDMQLPEGHPEIGDMQVMAPAPGMRDDTSVVQDWTAPESWTQAPDKPMRIVTFTMGESGQTECYVTSLSGPAGGVEANVNRWQQQMGQAPLDGPALAELPTITILGKPSPMIEITGDFTDMDGQGGDAFALLGAICPLEGETLFVKMTGPASEVQANKDEFIAFCESLR